MLTTANRQATAARSQPSIEVSRLIAGLASNRWADRRAAEDGLRTMGHAAVPELVNSLHSVSEQVRWGAAKVLGEIADPRATAALAESLEDVSGGVRWLAAGALISIGEPALVPVLRQLIKRGESRWLQEGAHHVLRGLRRDDVRPVIQALEDRFPSLAVPVAASDTLKEIELRIVTKRPVTSHSS